VIGAGISGLACAFRLKQLGLVPVVLESTNKPGGVIQTVQRNGYLFEAGPQCPRFPEPVWKLVRDLRLETEFIAGDPKAKRYILRNGHLHVAPFSPGGLIRTGLVDFRSKLRILTEVFGRTAPPDQEESLVEFVQRKFGEDVADYLVDPLISTIFLADPRKIGMQSAFPKFVDWERTRGSLIRGALAARRSSRNHAAPRANSTSHKQKPKTTNLRVTDALPSLGSFKSGMGLLPEALARELSENVRYGQGVASVSASEGGNGAPNSAWTVHLKNGPGITAESLVLAVPAYAAASLLQQSAPRLASLLEAIEYSPVCVVSAAYDQSSVSRTLDGFGFMVPRKEGLQTICTFWNSSLFTGRAPNGKVLVTSFAGRDSRSTLFTGAEADCAQIVHAENARVLGITGEPVDRVVWRNTRALPQYNVGHAQRVMQMTETLRELPNLHLAGSYLTGRSIADCAQIAFHVAENVHSRSEGKDIQ
jgi:protoporphyrinogen/coproporphyrinogen III oxidase